jgi:hypothetical protein
MTIPRVPLLTAAFCLGLCALADASDITLKNDSIPETGSAQIAVQGGLVPGEIAVALLAALPGEYPISLKNIKVFVAKQSPGAPGSMSVQLVVWSSGAPSGTTPDPGQAIYTSPTLTFTAGAFNTWDVSGANLVLTGTCLVGCKVVSTGQIGSPPFASYQPNNVTDTNGCQGGKNFIWAKNLLSGTFSWAGLCGFGASGDWVIHVLAASSLGVGQFTDLGAALGGDFSPLLTGSGSLADGGAFSIDVSGLPPAQTGFLFLGFAPLFADFKGGSLGPAPDVLVALPTGSGTLSLPGSMPAGTPGDFSFYMQMWTPDAGAPFGADATNTLQATTPP